MITKVVLGDLVIHSITDQPDMWLNADGIDGLGEVSTRLSVEENAGEDGGFVSTSLLGVRSFSLAGEIRGDTPAAYIANRQALFRACYTAKDVHGRPQPKRITITLLDGSERFIDAFPDRPQLLNKNILHDRFRLPFIAPDPVVYETGAQATSNITRTIGGGILVPFRSPFRLGASSGGRVTVSNTGTADVWPTITLTGVLTNPTIYHVDKGVTMKLSYTTTNSDTVVIDMKNHTVMLNGTTSLLYTKTSTSDWFSLAVGDNPLTFSTGNTGDTGTMRVSHYNGHLGI